MHVQGSVSPPAFWLRYVQGGYAIVRLTQNVTSTVNSMGQTVYDYEEIEFQVPDRVDVESYVIANASFYWSQALANAQNNQVDLINSGYQRTVSNGFQCAVSGTTYTFGWLQDATHNDQLHLSQVQQAIDKGIDTFPVPYADINSNIVNIPDQTTLTALDMKANSFGWSQIKQRRLLVGNVKSAATVSAVQSIIWTPATY